NDLDDAIVVVSREAPLSSVPLLLMRAHLLALRGDLREAAATMQQAEAHRASITDALLEAAARDTAARIAYHSGKLKLAVDLARAAIEGWRALGRPWEAIDCALILSLAFFRGEIPARTDDYTGLLEEAGRLGHHGF